LQVNRFYFRKNIYLWSTKRKRRISSKFFDCTPTTTDF